MLDDDTTTTTAGSGSDMLTIPIDLWKCEKEKGGFGRTSSEMAHKW